MSRRVLALGALLSLACAASPPPPTAAATAVAVATSPSSPAASAPAADSRADLAAIAAIAAKIDPLFAAFTPAGRMSPGCAVGVYRAGEILFSRGYGYADLEHDAPMTDTTPVYTASLSKQFTAAAVLLLVADGKLALGDDVRKYIPELPDFGTRITLEQMLHHTSGLRDYHLLLLLDGLNEEDVITRREVLWLLAHQRSLGFAPGAYFSYSSSGYVLLAEVVARVSGESFGAFLGRRVLGPLGMTESLVREEHARVIPHRAIGYTAGPGGQVRSLMGNLEYPGSSTFVSTTRDLAKWDANFYAPKVGGQALLDAMRVRGKLDDGTVLDYAMGLEETESHGLHVEEHDGGFAGYRTFLARYPSERLTVSVLCNTTEVDADDLGEKVAAVFLPQLSTPEPAATPPAVDPPAFGFDPATVAGTYVDESTAEVRTIEATPAGLSMRYSQPGARPRQLVVGGPGDLFVKGSHTHYRYAPARTQRPARLVRTPKGEAPSTFVRTEPLGHVEKLDEYAGRFGSVELAHDLEIRVEGGHLVSGPVGGASRQAAFTPVARDLFATEEEGWRFERDARGRIVRLVVSTGRARDVVLVRR